MIARARRAGAALASSGVLAYAFHRLGRDELASPRSWSPAALAAWADERGTVTAAMASARILAMAIALYLCALSLVLLVAAVARFGWLESLAARLTPKVVRAALGLGLTPALLTTGATAALASTDADDAPVMVHVGDSGDDTPVMHWDGAVIQPASTTTTRLAASTAPILPAVPVPPQVDTWTVARGDHFWSIAAETIHDRTGTEPTIDEIARYWRKLIDANRDRLVDPTNADLIYAGQEFVLPPL